MQTMTPSSGIPVLLPVPTWSILCPALSHRSVSRVCRLLACYNASLPILLGEVYGYKDHQHYGTRYVTGGGRWGEGGRKVRGGREEGEGREGGREGGKRRGGERRPEGEGERGAHLPYVSPVWFSAGRL